MGGLGVKLMTACDVSVHLLLPPLSPRASRGMFFLKSWNQIFGEKASLANTVKATGGQNNGPFVCLLKGHALEQRHYPEGLRGLHQEAAAGAAEGQGTGEPAEEAGARQPTSDAADTGKPGFQRSPNQQRPPAAETLTSRCIYSLLLRVGITFSLV